MSLKMNDMTCILLTPVLSSSHVCESPVAAGSCKFIHLQHSLLYTIPGKNTVELNGFYRGGIVGSFPLWVCIYNIQEGGYASSGTPVLVFSLLRRITVAIQYTCVPVYWVVQCHFPKQAHHFVLRSAGNMSSHGYILFQHLVWLDSDFANLMGWKWHLIQNWF